VSFDGPRKTWQQHCSLLSTLPELCERVQTEFRAWPDGKPKPVLPTAAPASVPPPPADDAPKFHFTIAENVALRQRASKRVTAPSPSDAAPVLPLPVLLPSSVLAIRRGKRARNVRGASPVLPGGVLPPGRLPAFDKSSNLSGSDVQAFMAEVRARRKCEDGVDGLEQLRVRECLRVPDVVGAEYDIASLFMVSAFTVL
jgi:hypothetical protein